MDFYPHMEGFFPDDGSTDVADPIEQNWYDGIMQSVAGDDPALRDATLHLVEEMAGIRTDGNDDYTYYGLPAAGASSDMFEEWD